MTVSAKEERNVVKMVVERDVETLAQCLGVHKETVADMEDHAISLMVAEGVDAVRSFFST